MTSETVRIGIDTNILVYDVEAGRASTDPRPLQARQLLERVRANPLIEPVVPVQVLLEFARVLIRKLKLPTQDVVRQINQIAEWGTTPSSDPATIQDALHLVGDGSFQMFDAVIVAACCRSGCAVLLSEDMQHGRRIGDMTISNPFDPLDAPALIKLLRPLN
jgi:predicted nucleic acid-binding protein